MQIFCTREIAKEGLNLLRNEGFEISIWEEKKPPSKEKLIEICQSKTALIVADRNRIDEEFLRACPHLKVISLHSVGYNHVYLDVAKELGIIVGNTPKGGGKATADTAFMLLLNVSKKAFYMHQQIRKGEWGSFEPTKNLGIDLRGKTLGIFGLGEIGTEMARLCKVAYDMTIIYHNRNRNLEAEKKLSAKYVDFEELLSKSDIISVHAGLNPSTRNKFDSLAFSKMKETAIFINTARGPIHDEKALYEALISHKVWGAGLDVTNPEPMERNHPLLNLPSVAITPHIGSAIDVARKEMSIQVAENIIAAFKGEKVPYRVV